MTQLTKLVLAAMLGVVAPAVVASNTLTTVSERSGFLKTGRYDEVVKLCSAFQAAYPKAVRFNLYPLFRTATVPR